MKVSLALVLIATLSLISDPFGHFGQRFSGNSFHGRDAPRLFQLLGGLNCQTLRWPDRRPIGSLVLATANAHWPGNPRGWFLDPTLNIRTTSGRQVFRQRLLAWADRSISILKDMHAQGMVTWDIEGEEFPHPTTYLGSPEELGRLAPEMNSAADEYFSRFTKAGLRVGLTIRPQVLSASRDGGTVCQMRAFDPVRVLNDKIAYARKRWGATLFYIDSNGDQVLPLPFSVVSKVADQNPGVLLIPEHKTAAYYLKTAPYQELRRDIAETPRIVRGLYPRAFSIINISDAPVNRYRDRLKGALESGDIILFHAWFADPVNDLLRPMLASRFPD